MMLEQFDDSSEDSSECGRLEEKKTPPIVLTHREGGKLVSDIGDYELGVCQKHYLCHWLVFSIFPHFSNKFYETCPFLSLIHI